MKKFLIALMAVVFVAGCSNSGDRQQKRIAKREARLAQEAAFTLGVDPSAVSISNVSGNAYGYRWQATTGGRSYNCSMMGGNFFSMGMSLGSAQYHAIAGGASATKSKKSKRK